VVAAFEQSLSSMTHRLQQLTATSQHKVRPAFHFNSLATYRTLKLTLRLTLTPILSLH